MSKDKNIDSFKYKGEKRAHIPSQEEAGMENATETVKHKTEAEYPVNPVVHRGQDPELFWLNKYGNDDREELLKIDIRSLYRHEHISPELLINKLYKIKESKDAQQLDLYELFGNTIQMDELEKVADYYKYSDDWKNRLIQGDSLLVMASLLEREGMAGKVQTIYFDPPYGIKYGSNWQMKLNSKEVKDGSDEFVSGEGEVIKAFRDTWADGIHSYLTYLRDRLLIARELLTESGSCFIQISDENIHLVRNIMDEVFGSENFVSIISYATTSGFDSATLARNGDYIIWYSKKIENVKYRQLYKPKDIDITSGNYRWVMLPNGSYRGATAEELRGVKKIPEGSKLYQPTSLISQGETSSPQDFIFGGKKYVSGKNQHWKTSLKGLERIGEQNRIHVAKNSIRYIRYANDFPFQTYTNFWADTATGNFTDEKVYVVQTSKKAIERCILLSSDPGDLVLDPTCGSGTTAYVSEQWGRRWITIDTSRIALNIAKNRLTTAVFPYYSLYDKTGNDIRQGFDYEKALHITLKNLANDEKPSEETLYDQPIEDKKKMRVAGPFTVETLQNFEPVSPEELDRLPENESYQQFEERIFEHLKSAGVKNGIKNENAVFKRVERKASAYLHAEGFYDDAQGKERKAYIHIGPKFGTVSKQAVNEAVKECRSAGDADWLIILGFSFESDISNENVTTSLGSFEVTKVRMHDDLMQDGLMKKDKKAASFVTIGEPDIRLTSVDGAGSPWLAEAGGGFVEVEILGLDIYDPISDDVKARNIEDIAYWMVDDAYDGSNFIARQVFFCGGDKDEFDKWKKGLSNLASQSTKAKAEKTLKIELDDDAWDRLYGFKSLPIPYVKGGKIAVRVISQFGEESTKVLKME
jgi:adenine-specific DNA-methyltransferase